MRETGSYRWCVCVCVCSLSLSFENRRPCTSGKAYICSAIGIIKRGKGTTGSPHAASHPRDERERERANANGWKGDNSFSISGKSWQQKKRAELRQLLKEIFGGG